MAKNFSTGRASLPQIMQIFAVERWLYAQLLPDRNAISTIVLLLRLKGSRMGVEQTSQLIQLILNSVLMVVASVVILGSLLVRYTAIASRCRALNRDYQDALTEREAGEASLETIRLRLLPLKAQLYRVRLLCRAAQNSILAMYLGLFCFVASTLCLALRTVFDLNGLINLSLWVFVLGVVVNLCGVALALLDFYIARSSLHEEIGWLFQAGAERLVQTVSPTRLSGRRGRSLEVRSGSAQVS